MVASLVAGNLLLSFFGISYGAMRIAGGFVVAVIGNQMLFGAKTPNDTDHGEKGTTDAHSSRSRCRESLGPGRLP